jgi:hypothetical protein
VWVTVARNKRIRSAQIHAAGGNASRELASRGLMIEGEGVRKWRRSRGERA